MLAKEPHSAGRNVQSGAQPIALLRRAGHIDLAGEPDPANPPEGIDDDLALAAELFGVGHVDVVHATAEGIRNVWSARGTRLHDLDRARKHDSLRPALDLGAHPLARNGAGDEDNRTVMARKHSPTGNGTFDVKV
jgi:hypothetical protein